MIATRICAKNSGELTWHATSRRSWTLQAGSTLRNTLGTARVVPADAKAVAAGRLGAEPGVQALVDQRVDGVYSTCVSKMLRSVDGRRAGPARFSQRP
jgi:hypothetical protein